MNKSAEQHWRVERDSDDIVWLYFDKANSTTNTLSSAVLHQLEVHLNNLSQKTRGLVILSAKSTGFIAGADVEEFMHIQDLSSATTLVHHGRDVFDRIAALNFPTVCLIEGYCLGGGLELALSFRYRVAEESTGTRLGLPEVMLGIYPGWGGVKRLPELIGAPTALDMMLTGRTLDAQRALKSGLVDYVVPKRQLKNAARYLIFKSPVPHRPKFFQRLLNRFPLRLILAAIVRKKLMAKASAKQYPAPYAIIDLWAHYDGDPLAVPKEKPASLINLLQGETARNLIRVFFLQERLKSLGRRSDFKAQHIHVIGAGVMGGDIASWCVLRGLHVSLEDQSPEHIALAIKRAHELFKTRLKRPREIQAAMDRLIPDAKGDGARQADIVIEAIFENLEAKQKLFEKLEPKLKPGAFMASNTSSIPLEQISRGLKHPEKLIGLHFFNPVAKMMLVEIVVSENTDADLVGRAAAFVRQIDRLPLPVKSLPGFLVNRILVPYMMEAIQMTLDGIKPEIVDAAAVQFGMPMGPIELADTVGLDIGLSVGKMLGQEKTPAALRLQELVKEGRLGKKTGKGFYEYKNGKIIKSSINKKNIPPDLQQRLINPMLREGLACLRDDVVEDANLLDAGVVFGTGFAPFRGGPMHYLKTHHIKL